MNVYIKHHDENNYLTHYGVKGMKWRKRKVRKDEAFYYGQDKAYADAERLYERNKTYRRIMDKTSYHNMSKLNPNSARFKAGVAFNRTWNKAFDAYAAAQTGKYRTKQAFKKYSTKTIKASKKAISSGKKKFLKLRNR